MKIIGRVKEQQLLEKAFKSSEAEFIAVYGRRRVGKTHLVREFFNHKKCYLIHVTGLYKGALGQQLKAFMQAVSETLFNQAPLEIPSTWEEAFGFLNRQLVNLNQKIVIFLDELPWMATRRSGLLQVLEYYWNRYWVQNPNVILVVCGSSASWLIKKIVYNKGGLHNRLTCQIRLEPFNLVETREFLRSKKVKLNDKHILALYMAIGGIPYYLKYVVPGLTAEQNIQNIIFDTNAPLKNEFDHLFQSLFENSDAYIELVKLIAKKKEGIRRAELGKLAKLSTEGGRLSSKLRDLSEAGFIKEYVSWGRSNGEYYKLIDEFSLFYLNWVLSERGKYFTKTHWIDQSQTQPYKIWAGYAFESVCMKHIDQIIKALNIHVGGIISPWRFIPRKKLETGAQIDLLIDRNDNAITLCEIKYTNTVFTIDKNYAKVLHNKIQTFQTKSETEKQLFLAIISANGVKENTYCSELTSDILTLEDLFH